MTNGIIENEPPRIYSSNIFDFFFQIQITELINFIYNYVYFIKLSWEIIR